VDAVYAKLVETERHWSGELRKVELAAQEEKLKVSVGNGAARAHLTQRTACSCSEDCLFWRSKLCACPGIFICVERSVRCPHSFCLVRVP
jgi:hypothetical protein